MRFNEFNEGIDPGAKAAIKGMRQLSGDQYYGLYKTMKDVAGHDGEKQTSPEGATDHEVSDKPFAYAYTDAEKNMIKGVDPKAKQITSDKSEEVKEAGRYDNRDAYQRDYDNSQTGFGPGERDSERHDIDTNNEYRAEHGTWYVRIDGIVDPTPYQGKAAANAAGLELKKQPGNENKLFMLTTKA
jgi:hypothetical protein